MVTTSTVIESEGRKLTTGEHSQRYPLEVRPSVFFFLCIRDSHNHLFSLSLSLSFSLSLSLSQPPLCLLLYLSHDQEVADVNMVNGEVEQWARPAVDGSDEAKQVDMFLESEHAAFQKAFEEDISGGGDATNAPPHVEVGPVYYNKQ